jgi:hypothetical protein
MLEDLEKAPTAASPKGLKRESKFAPVKKSQTEIEASKKLNKEQILDEFT